MKGPMKRILRSLRANPKRDVGDELAFHIDMRAAEFRAAGMSEEEARRAAIAAFGDVGAMKDHLTTVRRADVDERERRDRKQELWSDLSFAMRTFRKNAGFSAAALATLALGIGAAIAVFTVLNGVLLRPLPYRDPSGIAMIWMKSDKPGSAGAQLPVSTGFYLNALEHSRTLQAMGAFRAWPYTLTSSGDAERIRGARATPSLFTILGVRPMLGRTLNKADAQPGAEKVALLGHALWQRRFGGDSAILNKPLQLGDETFTIVGVMPEGFTFPRGAELPSGLQFPLRTELWTPLVFTGNDRTAYGTLNMAAIGRLKPGVTVAQARADLTGSLRALLERLNARTIDLRFETISMQEQAGAPVRRGLWLLMGAVGLVLFIACANVTNLLVARTTARRRELSMRAALGAGRARIARQLITENLVLAVLGTAAGVVLSIWVTRAMLAMVPGSLPRTDDVRVDWRVALGALALAIIAGAVFGAISTLQIRLGDLAATLREAGARTTGGPRGAGRQGLVTVEVALSVVLVVVAALLTLSFSRLQAVDAGIDATNVLTADIGLPVAARFDPARDGPGWASFFAQAQDRIAGVPGVRAAGFTSGVPLTRSNESGSYAVIGRPAPVSGQAPSADYSVIAGDYFSAAGITLLSGRLFDGRDQAGSTPVAVVSREFARVTFGDSSALGRQITTYFDWTGSTRTIIGVVEDTRQAGLDTPVKPLIYTPVSQMPYPGLRLFLRADADPTSLLPAIKRELKAIDPRVVTSEVRTFEEIERTSLARQRFTMTVLSIFAALALVLSAVGLYGVIALSVGQRTREIGVRMALGASSRDVVRQILGEGMRLAAVGAVVGIFGALAASRVIASMLFGVSAVNVWLYAAAIAGVLGVSAIATLLPARRATRVDPLLALRGD
jgi:putative ABC transport system permease protein